MKTSIETLGRRVGLGLAVGTLIFSAAACNEELKPSQAEQSPSALPTPSETQIGNSYHLVPVPCETQMPWKGIKSNTIKPIGITPDIRLDSMRIPKVEPTSGTGPECWQVVPDTTANPDQNSQ